MAEVGCPMLYDAVGGNKMWMALNEPVDVAGSLKHHVCILLQFFFFFLKHEAGFTAVYKLERNWLHNVATPGEHSSKRQ